jgi:heptosyltransferase-2
MPTQAEHGIFGVFKGIGDLLWASPVIRSELDRGLAIHLLIFPNPSLVSFCSLVDFGVNAHNLHLHAVPVKFQALFRFLRGMRPLSPQYIWISPHASMADSSYKMPLLLRLLKGIYWSPAPLVGASSERLSRLFDLRLEIDRTLPLSQREWSAYRLFRGPSTPAVAPRPGFLPAVLGEGRSAPVYDLVIHPGTSARNRTWPYRKYVTLLNALPSEWKIAIEGLPAEIEPLRALLTQAGIPQAGIPQAGIQALTWSAGPLQQALQTIAKGRLVLTMNTSFMHFANILGVPGLALFGSHHPSTTIGDGSIEPLYRVSAPCQPCGRSTCSQTALFCLDNIDPLDVAGRLIQMASANASSGGATSPRPSLTQIQSPAHKPLSPQRLVC